MKRIGLLLVGALMTFGLQAQNKRIYIPEDLRKMDLQADTSQWSFNRSAQTDDLIFMWERGFGQDVSNPPLLDGKPMAFNLNNLMDCVQSFYTFFRDTLAFIPSADASPTRSLSKSGSKCDRYKMMVMVTYSLDGTAYGGTYDNFIGALWVAPNRIQDTKMNCMAHELGHYVNEDTINRVADRDDTHVKSEYAADEEAWALLESVPEYSIGSQLTDNLLRKQGKYAFELNNTKSASDDKRIGAIIGHISKISGGRVKIDEACRLTVDGRPFMGTGYVPASDDATKEERTAYLAGQIASCMKDGLWTRSRVDYMPESEFCEGGRPDYTVVVIRKGETANGGPTGEIAKVLGTFAFSLKDNKYSRNVQAQKEADTVNAILSQMEGRERPSV